jgi:hypothetical protein
MPAVRSDWKKNKALEWLVDHVEVVDSDGQPIDRTLLEPESESNDSPDTETTETSVSPDSPAASHDQETGEP